MAPQGFRDRVDAGRRLAPLLAPLAGRPDVVVLALPRGGVPVAAEVAHALDAPLDLLLVRKLGVPWHEELAMGAIASDGEGGVVRVLEPAVLDRVRDAADVVERVTAVERLELARRERAYRGDRPPLDLRDRTVVLVDDGLATGATMRAAVAVVRPRGPRRVIAAAPVGASSTCRALREQADGCVCAIETPELDGVGRWYADFAQTSDAEVRAILADAAGRRAARAGAPAAGG